MENPQPTGTKLRKTVNRNVAIALGIICIMLVALITYFTVTGISTQNSYNNLQNQNRQLQTWLDGNETVLNQTQTWLTGNETLLSQTQADNINLQKQVNNQDAILNLNDSTIWVDNETVSEETGVMGEGALYEWTFSADYAGYVTVDLSASTDTIVGIAYSAYGVNYLSPNTDIGTNGTLTFPVLPCPSIKVGLAGGVSFLGIDTETVTITYYY
jgi:archaellum component FlaF (FlaF/FlaG flagellin family)